MKPAFFNTALAAAALLLAAAATGHAGDAAACVRLDAQTQARLGIVSARAQPVQRARSQPAMLQVLDPGTLVVLLSDLSSARAAADATGRETARLEGLVKQDFSAAPRDLDAMRAQSVANANLVQSVRTRLAMGWGDWIAELDTAALQTLINGLSGGSSLIARIDALGASSTGQGSVTIVVEGIDHALAARDIGAAKTADPRLQSLGRMLLLSRDEALPMAAGQMFAARIAGAPINGELLPNAALVRWNALDWIYVKRGDCFERRALAAFEPVADGVLLPAGTLRDAEVVGTGADALLASEFSASMPESD